MGRMVQAGFWHGTGCHNGMLCKRGCGNGWARSPPAAGHAGGEHCHRRGCQVCRGVRWVLSPNRVCTQVPQHRGTAGRRLTRAGGVEHLGLIRDPLGPASALAAQLSLGIDGAVPKSPGSPEVLVSEHSNAWLGLCTVPATQEWDRCPPKGTEGPEPSQPSCPPPRAAGGGWSWVKWDEKVLTPQAATCCLLPRAACCLPVLPAPMGR